MRWYQTLAPFVESLGYKQGKNDLCSFHHPQTKHRLVIHVDDLLTRGTREAQENFFTQLRERFDIKEPKYLSQETPLDFCGIRIQEHLHNNQRWYSMDQEEEMIKFLEEHQEFQGMTTVGAPMPDKHMLTLESPTLNQEKHKKYL